MSGGAPCSKQLASGARLHILTVALPESFLKVGFDRIWDVVKYSVIPQAATLRPGHAPTTWGSRDSSWSVLSSGTEHPGVRMNLLPAPFPALCHWSRICAGERSL